MNTLKAIWETIVAKSKTVWALLLKWFTPLVEEVKDIAKTVEDEKPKLKSKIKLRKKVKKASKKNKK